jgi:hypothetical protein
LTHNMRSVLIAPVAVPGRRPEIAHELSLTVRRAESSEAAE